MPLDQELRNQILSYCDRDIAPDTMVAAMFDFIEDEKLKERIESEFYAARYIYKLGEGLQVTEKRLHAHVKFQIVQYAGIYEAIIVHFLWSKFSEHQAVTDIEFHTVFKRVGAISSNLQLSTTGGEAVELCIQTRQRTNPISIKFDDKVDAAVKIGFVDAELGEEIKSFYKLRNAIHLESAIKNGVKYELASSQLAFRRFKPFTEGLRGFLRDGKLPKGARLKKPKLAAEIVV